MKCNQCNYENSPSAKYCESCGSRLFDQAAEGSESLNPELSQVEMDERMNLIKEGQEGNLSYDDLDEGVIKEPINPYPEAGKPKKKKGLILILVLVIVVAIAAAGVTFGQNFLKTDEERLMEAMIMTQEAKQKSVKGEFGFNDFKLEGVGVMEAAMAENIIKGLKINYQMMSDTEKYEAYGEMSFKMSGSELIKIGFFLNKEFIGISIPALYEHVVYVNWKDIKDILIKYEVATEDDLANIEMDPEKAIEKIEAYIEALNYENYDTYANLDVKKYEELLFGYYADFIIEVLKEKHTMDLDGESYEFGDRIYYMDMDYSKSYDSLMTFYRELIADPVIKQMVLEGMERFIAAIIAQEDDLMFNVLMSADEVMPVWGWKSENAAKLNELRDRAKTEIDKGYDAFIAEMDKELNGEEYKEMETFIKDIYGEIDMDVTMVLEGDYLKGQEMTITITDSIIDAINDSQLMQEEMVDQYGGSYGLGAGMVEDLDILFEIQMYNRSYFDRLDQEIIFKELPDTAVDFSQLTEEELFEIYMEIMENVQTLTSGFQTGF